jgi:FkbH-like protein
MAVGVRDLNLYWLPELADWRARLADVSRGGATEDAWTTLVALAGSRMDFAQTLRLDGVLQRLFGAAPPRQLATKPVRLALLGSSTLAHLAGPIRVAALRRGLWVKVYEPAYGQYVQELHDGASGLHAFAPTTVLIALDAHHLALGIDAGATAAQADAVAAAVIADLRSCWRLARERLHCAVLQQTVLPVFPPLLGNNEHRLAGSRSRLVERVNAALREAADGDGVDLLSLDIFARRHGIGVWHDPALWCRSKQEVSPLAAPLYGEMVARLLAARQGRSFKCLVLDLDNTLWGGVIGDDGLEGIILGQGDALGEGFLALQSYVREQGKRGVILAVCSKNDEANALAPFEKHPEMLLKRSEIASFVANWNDKASNIRAIAEELNIGLDSLVFVDDSPFERNLVRRELPMVAVPEIPDDPALVPHCLADAGYFEGLSVTTEDRVRNRQYLANRERETLKGQAGDLPSYLKSLEMRLIWRPFDAIGLHRIVQLINKTNQFNLTTRRYEDEDVRAVMADARAFGLQLRLVDRYGDNGIISIIIGRLCDAARPSNGADLVIDTWLMSCRVLGRQVEQASLNIVAAEARRLGATGLIGEYRPTAKNAMVTEHYQKLGFVAPTAVADGATRSTLDLAEFRPFTTFIETDPG